MKAMEDITKEKIDNVLRSSLVLIEVQSKMRYSCLSDWQALNTSFISSSYTAGRKKKAQYFCYFW